MMVFATQARAGKRAPHGDSRSKHLADAVPCEQDLGAADGFSSVLNRVTSANERSCAATPQAGSREGGVCSSTPPERPKRCTSAPCTSPSPVGLINELESVLATRETHERTRRSRHGANEGANDATVSAARELWPEAQQHGALLCAVNETAGPAVEAPGELTFEGEVVRGNGVAMSVEATCMLQKVKAEAAAAVAAAEKRVEQAKKVAVAEAARAEAAVLGAAAAKAEAEAAAVAVLAAKGEAAAAREEAAEARKMAELEAARAEAEAARAQTALDDVAAARAELEAARAELAASLARAEADEDARETAAAEAEAATAAALQVVAHIATSHALPAYTRFSPAACAERRANGEMIGGSYAPYTPYDAVPDRGASATEGSDDSDDAAEPMGICGSGALSAAIAVARADVAHALMEATEDANAAAEGARQEAEAAKDDAEAARVEANKVKAIAAAAAAKAKAKAEVEVAAAKREAAAAHAEAESWRRQLASSLVQASHRGKTGAASAPTENDRAKQVGGLCVDGGVGGGDGSAEGVTATGAETPMPTIASAGAVTLEAATSEAVGGGAANSLRMRPMRWLVLLLLLALIRFWMLQRSSTIRVEPAAARPTNSPVAESRVAFAGADARRPANSSGAYPAGRILVPSISACPAMAKNLLLPVASRSQPSQC